MKNSGQITEKNSSEQKVVLLPLGDGALLIRFGDRLEIDINQRAVSAAQIIARANISGVLEVCPTLVSALVRYDPTKTSFMELCDNVRMVLIDLGRNKPINQKHFEIAITYGGKLGPDLQDAASQCALSVPDFITAHNGAKLHVLATGFAPGFVYCGLHQPQLHIPRRTRLHGKVAPGSVLFAAGQTAITATNVPTGWSVIGHTDFSNFSAANHPPTTLRPGDGVAFVSKGARISGVGP